MYFVSCDLFYFFDLLKTFNHFNKNRYLYTKHASNIVFSIDYESNDVVNTMTFFFVLMFWKEHLEIFKNSVQVIVES